MRTILPLLLLSSLSLSFACSSEPGGPNGTGGAAPSSGGVGPGSGGEAPASGGGTQAMGGSASGGASAGGNGAGGIASTGGVTNSTGGAAAGGGSGGDAAGGAGGNLGTGGTSPAFVCPEGSAELTPTLGAASAVPGTLPDMPNNWNSIAEGPVWRNGKLYLSQMRDYGPLNPSRLLSYDGATFNEEIPIVVSGQDVTSHAGTNGLALAADGRLIGASHAVGGLVWLDVEKSPIEATTIVAEFEGLRLNSPNDLAIRSDGVIYVSDPDWQCSGGTCPQPVNRVYYYAGGALHAIATDHAKPNGVALSPDESTLYVGGDGSLVSYPVMADGSVGAAAPFGNVIGADGLAVDCAGNLYVATENGVVVLSPAGTSLGTITVQGSPTNAAFGGSDRKTLYITTNKTAGLYQINVGVPGYPY